MHTRVIPVSHNAIADAAEVLTSHLPIVVPTETVYGLAARYDDEKAVQFIFHIKGRPRTNPLIVHIASADDLSLVAKDIPDTARALATAFWPGPLSIVLKAKQHTPWTTGGFDTIAVRVPDNTFLRSLIQKVGPLAAPSANISGKPSPTTVQHVLQDFSGKIPLVVDGGVCAHGLESTVVDLTQKPAILRPGAVTAKQLQEILGEVQTDSDTPSPGTKHTHYTPHATVEICTDINKRLHELPGKRVMTISQKETGATISMVYDERSHLANQLYAAFRQADEQNIDIILFEPVEKTGIGAAIMNRVEKAAKRS